MKSVQQQSIFAQALKDPNAQPLVVCAESQEEWAMALGTPVYACPQPSQDPSEFAELAVATTTTDWIVEPVERVIDSTWFIRPSAIIHLGALLLLESKWSVIAYEQVLKSVGAASVAAYTLSVPFIFVSPAGPVDIPATERGVQALMLEDQVRADQHIVRANGVFGPKVTNRVKRWIESENLTVDDKRQVNPIYQPGFDKMVLSLIEAIQMGTAVPGGYVMAGGPQTTWYDFFVDANVTTATPWTDPLSEKFVREELFEWPHSERRLYPKAHSFLKGWHSQVHD